MAGQRAGHAFISILALAAILSLATITRAQTPGTLYTFGAGTSDWFKNFGTGTATLSNSAGSLLITETSATAGTGAAWSDGFNTIRDNPNPPFTSGCCGGLDLTGLSTLEFDLGHSGVGPINVQVFTQATPASNFVGLGPDLVVIPGVHTYSVPLAGLTSDQATYMRTIGLNIRDHAGEGNLTWTLSEVRSTGTPAASRVIANHDNGPGDFDGVICNFDCGAIVGGNGGQNTSGMSIVGNALHFADAGGGPGAAITWGNGTQDNGGSFNARPVDLSNYDFATIRMMATGLDPSVGIQFYMQTGGAFTYQSLNDSLPVDGAYHDLVFPLAGITNRVFTDTNGINIFGQTNDLQINVDSVIYSSVPEPASLGLVGLAMLAFARRRR